MVSFYESKEFCEFFKLDESNYAKKNRIVRDLLNVYSLEKEFSTYLFNSDKFRSFFNVALESLKASINGRKKEVDVVYIKSALYFRAFGQCAKLDLISAYIIPLVRGLIDDDDDKKELSETTEGELE